jgi:hypothetical protein
MTKVTRLAACTTLAALVLLASAAFAAKQAPNVTSLGASPVISSLSLGNVTQSTCMIGVTDPPAYIIDYIFPPADAYYTLLDPATCDGCNGGPVSAVTAHAWINFRAVCAQPIKVGIYAATGDASCWVPDPTTALCPEISFTVTPPAPGNYDVGFPIPAGCCITGPAFLKIEFGSFGTGCTTSTTWPRLITTADCSIPCNSWNIYPGGGPDDLCYDIGFPGYPVMSLEADCCNPTPTQKHSWGSLKSTYR